MKNLFLSLMLVIAVILAGCSKTGEDAAVNYVKSRCNVPDSFVKVNYDFDKSSRLARLDYKAKNMLGVELTGIAYFRVGQNKITYINTENVGNPILDFLQKNHSADFEEQIENYKRLLKIEDKYGYDMELFLSELNDDDLDVRNYYTMLSFQRHAKKYNKAIKEIKETYARFPDDFKKYLESEHPFLKKIKGLHYFKIKIQGDALDWKIDTKNSFQFVDEYPE